MKRLGLSLTDSSGKMKPMSQLTEELRDKFSGLTAEQKAQEAASLAGKTGMSGLLAIVNASDKDYKKLTKSIDECDGSSKKMADTMINNLSGQITILKSQLEGVAIQIGEIVVPKIKEFVTHIQGLVDKFSKLDRGTQTTIVKIAGIVAAIAPVLLTVGKLSSGIGKIITLFGRIGGLASPIGIVVAAIAALAGVFAYAYKNNSKFREQVNGLVSGLKATLLPVIEKLKTVFTNLWTGTLQPLLSNLATSFTSTLSQILPALTNIIQTVLPQLANVIATIVPLIANIVATVLPQLADMINTILPTYYEFCFANNANNNECHSSNIAGYNKSCADCFATTDDNHTIHSWRPYAGDSNGFTANYKYHKYNCSYNYEHCISVVIGSYANYKHSCEYSWCDITANYIGAWNGYYIYCKCVHKCMEHNQDCMECCCICV